MQQNQSARMSHTGVLGFSNQKLKQKKSARVPVLDMFLNLTVGHGTGHGTGRIRWKVVKKGPVGRRVTTSPTKRPRVKQDVAHGVSRKPMDHQSGGSNVWISLVEDIDQDHPIIQLWKMFIY